MPGVTASTVRFFNGAPNAGGTVIAGGATTNVLAAGSNAFLNIFRVTTTTLSRRRPGHLQTWTSTLGSPLVLNAGTYWLDYNDTGSEFRSAAASRAAQRAASRPATRCSPPTRA